MPRDPQQALQRAAAVPVVVAPRADEPLPRRSFLTGRVLDPELHPPLRQRVARAMHLSR